MEALLGLPQNSTGQTWEGKGDKFPLFFFAYLGLGGSSLWDMPLLVKDREELRVAAAQAMWDHDVRRESRGSLP